MTMKRCTAAVLLMLSLGALAAGRLSAAVADDGVDTILLPSHGSLADESVTATGDGEKRPWGKCCDHTFCNRRMPPGCRCMDPVERCDDACSRCEVHPSDPSKHICMDRYTGEPGPSCTELGNNDDDDTPGLADELVTAAVTRDDTKRPLKGPPCWQCPFLQECSKGGRCQVTTNNGCGDGGRPGADPGLAGPHEATAEAVSKMNVNDGEEETRPWKCCDLARCTRSMPPTCQCTDKVKKCAKTCKSCEKVEGSSRYVCLDSYRGKQGPACTPGPPPPPTFTPRGN